MVADLEVACIMLDRGQYVKIAHKEVEELEPSSLFVTSLHQDLLFEPISPIMDDTFWTGGPRERQSGRF